MAPQFICTDVLRQKVSSGFSQEGSKVGEVTPGALRRRWQAPCGFRAPAVPLPCQASVPRPLLQCAVLLPRGPPPGPERRALQGCRWVCQPLGPLPAPAGLGCHLRWPLLPWAAPFPFRPAPQAQPHLPWAPFLTVHWEAVTKPKVHRFSVQGPSEPKAADPGGAEGAQGDCVKSRAGTLPEGLRWAQWLGQVLLLARNERPV